MGPYKRPGQTFTDADKIYPSPFLSARAEVAARYAPPLTQQLPLIEPVALPQQSDDEAVFAMVALEELSGDWLRGPLTLRVIRRKV